MIPHLNFAMILMNAYVNRTFKHKVNKHGAPLVSLQSKVCTTDVTARPPSNLTPPYRSTNESLIKVNPLLLSTPLFKPSCLASLLCSLVSDAGGQSVSKAGVVLSSHCLLSVLAFYLLCVVLTALVQSFVLEIKYKSLEIVFGLIIL